jgi:hypothetical protein
MKKWVRVVILVAFSLVLVAGGLVVACSSGQAALEMPDMEIFQYLKGTMVDFNDATLNAMAEPGGEAGFKFGLMKAIYPDIFESNKDAVAAMVYPPPYKIIKSTDNASVTTYAMLTAGDATVVDGTIYALKLTAAEQDVVMTAVAGFFSRVENDSAAAKAPAQTSAYAILQGVSSTAADNWASEVASMDYADRFFINLVKEYVSGPYASAFAPFWAILGYPGPTYPTDNVTLVEAVARIAGESSFKNATASTMYPTLREEIAQTDYDKAYAELGPDLKPLVDAKVYQALPSAFGTGAGADAAREAVRNGMAYNLKGLYGLSSDNYTLLTGVEKALVDQAIGSQLDAKDACGKYSKPLGFGPHLEREYIDFFAVPGAVLGWGAEMAAAKPLDQNTACLALKSSVSVTAAEHWIADVEAGTHPRQAYYRWLAKEAVSAFASAGPLIQLSVAEFYVKITNPNDYDISVDSMNVNFQVPASSTGELVDAAKQALGDKVWVPANDEIIFRLLAPVKTYDVITWGVLSGKSSTEAGVLAADVWGQIQAGTADWTVTVEAQASNETETLTKTYTLTWSAS